MASASADLIKNSKKGAAPPAAAAEDTQVVDVEKMSGKQLDALVKDNQIETPENWSKMKVDEKKAWLKETFENTDDEAGEKEAEASAPEPAKTPAKSNGKATTSKAASTGASKPAKAAKTETSKEPAKAAETTSSKRPAAAASKGVVPKKGEDKLSDLINEIEHLSEKTAKALITTLSEDSDFSVIKLGGVLSRVQAQNWFAPYASFKEFVENEHGMKFRRAVYYVQIYNDLAESGVAWSDVAHLGWTKLKEISSVLTKQNVKKWVTAAEKNTTIQLHEIVVQHKKAKAEGSKSPDEQAHKQVSTKTFKVHDEQKAVINSALEKAKADGNTQYDTVALEHICTDYMGGMSMVERLRQLGPDKAIEALGQAFPDIDFSINIPEGTEVEVEGAEQEAA